MNYSKNQMSLHVESFLTVLGIERNLSPKTLKAYQCDLNNMMHWFHCESVNEINANSILKYFEYLQKTKQLKPRTLCRKFISIKQFFQFLNLENITSESFFRFTSRKFRLPKSIPKTLSSQEIQSLILTTEQECTNMADDFRRLLCTRDKAIIELLFCLGLRISELHLLNCRDYRPYDQTVFISGKGNKERLLYISSSAVTEKLQKWIEVRQSFNTTSNALFLNRFGNRLSIYGIENIFKKYRDLASINPASTPHYLRHSFATQLLNNGASIRDVQEILGHQSIVTTQIYTEVSINRKKHVLSQYNGRNFLFY